MDILLTAAGQLPALPAEHGTWLTTAARFLFPALALLILTGAVRSLLTVPHEPETWAYLTLPNGAAVPLTHWENILGRGKAVDVRLTYPTVSRRHAALIRSPAGGWTVYDLGALGGVRVNQRPVAGSAPLAYGDVLELGGVETVLLPVPPEERQRRRTEPRIRPAPPWRGLFLLTLFQALAALQLTASEGPGAGGSILAVFACLAAVMWAYVLVLRLLFRRVGFEMETIAFFLSTLSLGITASSHTSALPKQLAAVLLGLALFQILEIILRDLERVKKLRWLMAAAAMGLCGISLVLGQVKYGAANWIQIGGVSLQPSELAKICYIFAGAATLDRLFRRRNLGLFILLTGVCMGCLALMSDFGTAAVFFATFLVIAYLRSGDFAALALITGAAVFGVLVILSIKPYILRRFAVWGHAWEQASAGGYQQVRAMSAAGRGGHNGGGPGAGCLHPVAAADTNLVFGMLCEEWGLVIAVLAVLCIVTLAVFAVRACRAGRSSFYTIAACAATSLLVVQTGLNVFGAVDLLPLTGVTFPFVSNGGSSMLCAWGLLAFLKATDTRTGASIAIRLPSRREERENAALARRPAPGPGEEESHAEH